MSVGVIVDALTPAAGLALFILVLANQAGVPVPVTPSLLAADRAAIVRRAPSPGTRRITCSYGSPRYGLFIPLIVAAAAGCATIQAAETRSIERLLSAGGFQREAADTPAKLAELRTLPPRKVLSTSIRIRPSASACTWVASWNTSSTSGCASRRTSRTNG